MTADDSTPRLPEEDFGLRDPRVPHPSGTYAGWIGDQRDALQADLRLQQRVLEVFPQARTAIRSQRLFLERAVTYLVAEEGIRQILDIGSGMPQKSHAQVHEIAQHIAPETKVAYVDVNPVAASHMDAREADGDTVVAFTGDLCAPDDIINHPLARATLDFDRPMGLLLVGIIHFLTDEEDPAGKVARLRDALAPGSFVVMNQISAELDERMIDVTRVWHEEGFAMVQRPRAQVEQIITGFEPVDPGIVPVHHWRPDGVVSHDYGTAYAVVARKP